MAEYFRIVYVNTRSDGGLWPTDIESFRDWTWLQSPFVRWEGCQFREVNTPKGLQAILSRLTSAQLLVFDWANTNPEAARELHMELRKTCPTLPVLIVDYSSGREPIRDDFAEADPRVVVISETVLGRTQAINEILEYLSVTFPQVQVKVDSSVGGVVTQSLIESLGKNGRSKLETIIQKFFPDAKFAQVEPVGGGWSGTGLVRLFVKGHQDSYFLKFFTNGKAYESELRQHQDAVQWLGQATVKIRPVPGIPGSAINQTQAFPSTTPFVFPVCYESASTRDHPRQTLKQFYQSAEDGELKRGLRRLLDVLATNQPVATPQDGEPPWSSPESLPETRDFCLPRDFKENLLETLDDLSLYGRRSWVDWEHRENALQQLIHELPHWLTDWKPVVRGHIHGDPNPRNCLIAPNNPNDLALIDCGDYRPNGRLVSDLAVVERDIKLVMMGLEEDAQKFHDLDVRQLGNWYRAEKNAMEKRLAYTSDHAIVRWLPFWYCSATRAHRLVGIVRQRAKELCGDWDPEGKHYFAALLYWTLEILQYPAVRRTKKLLALYSASEILQVMQQK